MLQKKGIDTMLTTYHVKFYDINEVLTDSCAFYLDENEDLLTRLEETLYCAQELTPVNSRRTTARMMRDHGFCYYTYHNLENQIVEQSGEHEFSVWDC